MTVHTQLDEPPQLPYDTQHGDNLHLQHYRQTASQRIDGWSPDKQRIFLQALAEGVTVGHACRIVGLSTQSAYAFRLTAKGSAFALGWQAAVLRSRDALADDLMMRAKHGNVETITRPDGETVERHRMDNRLGMQMLARLDRLAENAARDASHAAARLVAQEFEPYLDLFGREAGPARAGLFVAVRTKAASDDDLAPLRVLARADKWLRTHTDLAEAIDTSDLDPAARAGWTAGQWLRAEAAGLMQLAPPAPRPPAPKVEECQENQHFVDPDNPDGAPVWWATCYRPMQWRTSFPPPEDFDGDEEGEYGDLEYSRALTAEEEDAVEAPYRAETEARRAVESVERDAWFAAVAADDAAPAPGDLVIDHAEIATDFTSAPAPNAAPARSTRQARKAGVCEEQEMSIMSRIKDAILGRGGGIFGEDSVPDPIQAAPAANPAAAAPTPQSQQATPAAAPQVVAPVDVERVLTEKMAAKGNPDLNWRTSIVDLMKLLDLDSSLDNRKELATELGYAGAKDGSAGMNLWLHNAVMLELANNGAKVPEKLAD